MTYDVRAIANLVLDCASSHGKSVTNLALNKIVFFLHTAYLTTFERPLVSAKIEAWEYGPVFREIYQSFKSYRDQPIDTRAYRLSPITGDREVCTVELTMEESQLLVDEIGRLIEFSASNLVQMSHVPGGPWDVVWNHKAATNPSMRISDEIILACQRNSARH